MFSELKEKASPGTFPVSHPSLGFQVLLLTPPSDIPPPGPGEHSLLGKRHTSVVHSCFQAAEGFQTDREVLAISVLKLLGNGTPLQYPCLENPMDRGAWWAAVRGVTKSRTQLSDFTLTFHFHALGKEMAPHSSVLACRIPGMEEPGGLQSMGSRRLGHN